MTFAAVGRKKMRIPEASEMQKVRGDGSFCLLLQRNGSAAKGGTESACVSPFTLPAKSGCCGRFPWGDLQAYGPSVLKLRSL